MDDLNQTPTLPKDIKREPLKRKKLDIPDDMRKELGIPDDARTPQEILEAMPEVQDALQEFEQQEGASQGQPEGAYDGKGHWMAGVTKVQLEERNLRIVELSQSGLTPETILKHINAQAVAKNWGVVKTARTINKIVSDYFQSQKPSVREAKGHEEGLKEAMFHGMSKMIEQMSLYIAKRNQRNNGEGDWKTFEYTGAMEALFRMRQALVDNKNWNASRMNPLLQVQINNSHLNIFDKNAQVVIENKEAMRPVIDLIDELLGETPEGGDEEVIDVPEESIQTPSEPITIPQPEAILDV